MPLVTQINQKVRSQLDSQPTAAVAVQGWLHTPTEAALGAVGLTHGAGSNCQGALLIAVAEALAECGYAVLRYDLPFRQLRPSGPPVGGKKGQAVDRDGVRAAAAFLREQVPNLPVYLAGHSYGGRQSTIAVSEDPTLADGLLLLSYPLHPPRQPEKLRTEHFPALRTPALFVHGAKDEFGTQEEMRVAIAQIPSRTELMMVDRAGHSLAVRAVTPIVQSFVSFLAVHEGKGQL
ncbi:MAG: alpha/beta fold hydrolase [Acidobacteriota bacterium]